MYTGVPDSGFAHRSLGFSVSVKKTPAPPCPTPQPKPNPPPPPTAPPIPYSPAPPVPPAKGGKNVLYIVYDDLRPDLSAYVQGLRHDLNCVFLSLPVSGSVSDPAQLQFTSL